jgi:hypothetical protein
MWLNDARIQYTGRYMVRIRCQSVSVPSASLLHMGDGRRLFHPITLATFIDARYYSAQKEHKYKLGHSQSSEIVLEVIMFNPIYITHSLKLKQLESLYSTTTMQYNDVTYRSRWPAGPCSIYRLCRSSKRRHCPVPDDCDER